MTRRALRWAGDAAVVAVAAVETALNVGPGSAELVAGVVAVLVLTVRRWSPLPAFLLTLPVVVLSGAMIPTMATLFTVAARYRSRWLLGGCGVLAAASNAVPWIDAGLPYVGSAVVLGGIYATMTALAPILLSRLRYTQRELALRLEEIKQVREHERRLDAEAILAQERNRLAREMHDVVAHQVSLIAVQAGALQVSTADPAARHAAENVRQLSVNTLDELRHMVNLLRASGTPATRLTPQPTLADLHRLVTDSGIDTELTIDAPDGIDAPVQRTIYRTVQEALTNVRKHAPGATASVDISHDDTELTVTVTNSPPAQPSLALPSARHGLVGLRERAALLGGTIHAAPLPDGGFRLQLRVPVANTRARRR